MRTKIIVLAALAAGAITAMAQTSNVYSLNVVGYVNTVFNANNFAIVAAPLDPGTNNLTSLVSSATAGANVYTWNAGIQNFDATIPSYSTKKSAWQPEVAIPTAAGFFVYMTATNPAGTPVITNTWVGNVRQGALDTTIAGPTAFNMVGSLVPLGGSLTTNVMPQYPNVAGTSGDSIYTWNVGIQNYDATITSYSTKKAAWQPDVNLDVAQGFFLFHNGGQVTYTRNFTVQ